jgi:serine O-acetyltransferase
MPKVWRPDPEPTQLNLIETSFAHEADDLPIEKIIRELHTLRMASQARRYRGAPPDLPSRDDTVSAVEGLVAALYPRHFGPAGLRAKDVDRFVGRKLAESLMSLRRQIELELRLAGEREGHAHALTRHAANIIAEFADHLPGVRALLDADVRAAYTGDPSAKSIDEVVFCFPGVGALIRHRLAHQLYLLGAPMLARIIAEKAHSDTGIDIHPGAQIGEGFFIDHGTGVVIGETTIIGRNVRIYQAVTLGAKRFVSDGDGQLLKNYPRHPIIEDDVVIYAGATVLGRITLGRGASIGGNVWLTHSVPPGAIITQAKASEDILLDGAGI